MGCPAGEVDEFGFVAFSDRTSCRPWRSSVGPGPTVEASARVGACTYSLALESRSGLASVFGLGSCLTTAAGSRPRICLALAIRSRGLGSLGGRRAQLGVSSQRARTGVVSQDGSSLWVSAKGSTRSALVTESTFEVIGHLAVLETPMVDAQRRESLGSVQMEVCRATLGASLIRRPYLDPSSRQVRRHGAQLRRGVRVWAGHDLLVG